MSERVDSQLQEPDQVAHVISMRTGQLLSQTQQFNFSGKQKPEESDPLDALFSFQNQNGEELQKTQFSNASNKDALSKTQSKGNLKLKIAQV